MTTLQSEALENFLSGKATRIGNPIIGVWGDTGVGKTTFVASLMSVPRYRKVLYIDGDRGAATIAHLTVQDSLCDYRYPKNATMSLDVQQWMVAEIAKAHKVPDVGAIVIEGLARLYESAVGEAYQNATEEQLKGHKLRQLYIVPSGHVKAVLEMVCCLQARLQQANRAVPIFVTCNSKEAHSEDGSKHWDVPGISDSAAKIIMARGDAFVQLERSGNTLSVRTDRDNNTKFRKVRHHGAAVAIGKLKQPTAVSMLQTWADAIAAESQAIGAHLHTLTKPDTETIAQ